MRTHSSKDEALEMWATGISLCHHIFADLQVSLAIFQLGSVFTEGFRVRLRTNWRLSQPC